MTGRPRGSREPEGVAQNKKWTFMVDQSKSLNGFGSTRNTNWGGGEGGVIALERAGRIVNSSVRSNNVEISV